MRGPWLRLQCGSVRIIGRAGVPYGNRTIVMRSQTKAELDGCQLYFSGYQVQRSLAHIRTIYTLD